MRIAYLDEAGISKHEPFAVVAAVLINGDDWKKVAAGLALLADRCAPKDKREGFIFHAKELYHGGKTLTRAAFPPEHGRSFLESLVHIPKDNRIPVSMGWVEKEGFEPQAVLPDNPRDQATFFHATAFMNCVVVVDRVMREAYPDELVQLVAEDNAESRRAIKASYEFMNSPLSAVGLSEETKDWLPLRHVIDTVHFAKKSESSPLQLADACAFAIRRHLERRPDAATYYEPLAPALTVRPKSDGVIPGFS